MAILLYIKVGGICTRSRSRYPRHPENTGRSSGRSDGQKSATTALPARGTVALEFLPITTRHVARSPPGRAGSSRSPSRTIFGAKKLQGTPPEGPDCKFRKAQGLLCKNVHDPPPSLPRSRRPRRRAPPRYSAPPRPDRYTWTDPPPRRIPPRRKPRAGTERPRRNRRRRASCPSRRFLLSGDAPVATKRRRPHLPTGRDRKSVV